MEGKRTSSFKDSKPMLSRENSIIELARETSFRSSNHDPEQNVALNSSLRQNDDDDEEEEDKVEVTKSLTNRSLVLLFLVGIMTGTLNGVILWGTKKFSQQIVKLIPLEMSGWNYGVPLYIAVSVALVALSAYLCGLDSAALFGSGMPEVKALLASDFSAQQYHTLVSAKVFVVRITTIVLCLAPGLSVGATGPLVHVTTCTAYMLMKLIPDFNDIFESPSITKQIFAASAAAGLSGVFNAPVGGLLFSVEVTSTFYLISNYWRSFMAAIAGAIMYNILVLANSEQSSNRTFKLTTIEKPFEEWEVPFMMLLGLLVGFMCDIYTKMHQRWFLFVRPYNKSNAILVAANVMAVTAILIYVTGAYSSEGGLSIATVVLDLLKDNKLSDLHRYGIFSNFSGLVISFVARCVMTIIGTNVRTPGGLFMPMFVLGALFGRGFGEVVQYMTGTEIYLGGYAMMGAVAFVSGTTHTISTAVIAVEMTGQLEMLLPCLIGAVLASAITKTRGLSMYDQGLVNKGLESFEMLLKEVKGLKFAGDIMDEHTQFMVRSCKIGDLFRLLETTKQNEFPLINSKKHLKLVGAVTRVDLYLFLMRHCEKANVMWYLERQLPSDYAELQGKIIRRKTRRGNRRWSFVPGAVQRKMSSSELSDTESDAGWDASLRRKSSVALLVHSFSNRIRRNYSSVGALPGRSLSNVELGTGGISGGGGGGGAGQDGVSLLTESNLHRKEDIEMGLRTGSMKSASGRLEEASHIKRSVTAPIGMKRHSNPGAVYAVLESPSDSELDSLPRPFTPDATAANKTSVNNSNNNNNNNDNNSIDDDGNHTRSKDIETMSPVPFPISGSPGKKLEPLGGGGRSLINSSLDSSISSGGPTLLGDTSPLPPLRGGDGGGGATLAQSQDSCDSGGSSEVGVVLPFNSSGSNLAPLRLPNEIESSPLSTPEHRQRQQHQGLANVAEEVLGIIRDVKEEVVETWSISPKASASASSPGAPRTEVPNRDSYNNNNNNNNNNSSGSRGSRTPTMRIEEEPEQETGAVVMLGDEGTSSSSSDSVGAFTPPPLSGSSGSAKGLASKRTSFTAGMATGIAELDVVHEHEEANHDIDQQRRHSFTATNEGDGADEKEGDVPPSQHDDDTSYVNHHNQASSSAHHGKNDNNNDDNNDDEHDNSGSTGNGHSDRSKGEDAKAAVIDTRPLQPPYEFHTKWSPTEGQNAHIDQVVFKAARAWLNTSWHWRERRGRYHPLVRPGREPKPAPEPEYQFRTIWSPTNHKKTKVDELVFKFARKLLALRKKTGPDNNAVTPRSSTGYNSNNNSNAASVLSTPPSSRISTPGRKLSVAAMIMPSSNRKYSSNDGSSGGGGRRRSSVLQTLAQISGVSGRTSGTSLSANKSSQGTSNDALNRMKVAQMMKQEVDVLKDLPINGFPFTSLEKMPMEQIYVLFEMVKVTSVFVVEENKKLKGMISKEELLARLKSKPN